MAHERPSTPWWLVCLAIVLGGCDRRDEAARDVWALWLENEPLCAAPADHATGPPLSPRWRLAQNALDREALAAMEERLTAVPGGGGESRRLAIDLVAGTRRLCELTRGRPVAALASTLARTRGEVADARSRLATALPLGDEEVRRRAGRWDRRLAGAVSRALEAAEGVTDAPSHDPMMGSEPDDGDSRGRVDSPPMPDQAVAVVDPSLADPPSPAAEHTAPDDSPPRISIRPSVGGTWAEMHRRRREEADRRFARWYPLYQRELGSLVRLRSELARQFERESLEGLHGLCTRLGRAAERVPPNVVTWAPAADLETDLAALLAAYSEAGRACAEGRQVRAWGRLTAGDRHWVAAAQRVELLAKGPAIPESLMRRSRRGNAAASRAVE